MRIMKRLVLVGSVCALSALAAPKPFAGAWKIVGDVSGTPVSQTCTFAVKDAVLTGACVGDEGRSLDLTGELHETSVTWKVTAEWDGSPIVVTFSGTLDTDSTMAGKIDVQPFGVEGTFKGTKAPPAS